LWRRLLRRRDVAHALRRFNGAVRMILESEPEIVLTSEL
jgi:hypothetical protein